MHPLRWTVALLMMGIIAAAPARGEDAELRVQVVESYIDLHTGPAHPIQVVPHRIQNWPFNHSYTSLARRT